MATWKDFCNLALVHMYQSDGEYPDKGKTSQYLSHRPEVLCGHKYQTFGRQTNKQNLSSLPGFCAQLVMQ